jgi:DNA polymerase III alpha subunit
MTYSICCPELSFTKQIFALEDNNLPFDQIVKEKVEKYCSNKFETINVKSIYYNLKEDFKAYLTFRCINNRTTLNKPNLEHMSSDEFSFESWKQANNL